MYNFFSIQRNFKRENVLKFIQSDVSTLFTTLHGIVRRRAILAPEAEAESESYGSAWKRGEIVIPRCMSLEAQQNRLLLIWKRYFSNPGSVRSLNGGCSSRFVRKAAEKQKFQLLGLWALTLKACFQLTFFMFSHFDFYLFV